MRTPSNTSINSRDFRDDVLHQQSGWLNSLGQRNRLWLLLISLLIAAFVLGGCHARGGGHVHASSCGSSSADSALAVFYVVYLLGWIIVSSTGG